MIGVRGFYLLTQDIKTHLLADENVNTVTTGDISDVDLGKQTIFPLSHLMINNANIEDNTIAFNVSVLVMDLVDESKEEVADIFIGNNNEQDVLNTQLAVLNKLVSVLKNSNLYQGQYELSGVPSCEPFYERFENRLAGWSCTFDVMVKNDISICN